jgi:serine/threonine protein kinase
MNTLAATARNRRTAMIAASIALGFLALAFASVPLYRLFCQATGFAGTPLYLAPEILDGSPATIAGDIYSLGVLLYQLVTLAYPVEGETIDAVRAAHERSEATPLAEGWQERVPLHQLFPLLVHAALFGGGYGSRAAEAARSLL